LPSRIQKGEERVPLIQPSDLPKSALLNRYALSGAYTDCYCMDMSASISFAQYVRAFYTTPIFKVERSILSLVARRPSSDEGAEALAHERAMRFAAWDVEDRSSNQLLMRDFTGRTRSWLMASPFDVTGSMGVRLYFGSAVVPKSVAPNGHPSFGIAFHVLHGFHHLYAKALMRAAYSKLNVENQ